MATHTVLAMSTKRGHGISSAPTDVRDNAQVVQRLARAYATMMGLYRVKWPMDPQRRRAAIPIDSQGRGLRRATSTNTMTDKLRSMLASGGANIWEIPQIRGTIFGGPHNMDYSILGSKLGPPNFGKLPYTSSNIILGSSSRQDCFVLLTRPLVELWKLVWLWDTPSTPHPAPSQRPLPPQNTWAQTWQGTWTIKPDP